VVVNPVRTVPRVPVVRVPVARRSVSGTAVHIGAAVRVDSAAPDASSPELTDEVAVEEPLAIRVSGELVATTMRTPGHDRELALGYLFSEGAVTSLGEVSAVVTCGRPSDSDYGNVIEVTPSPGTTLRADPLARLATQATMSSACGVCGREQILALAKRCASLHDLELSVTSEQILHWVQLLGRAQTVFARTGGLHAAVSVEAHSGVHLGYEDVGRHNAVDKVIGALLLAGQLSTTSRVLLVTSRASFEIVQKAAAARFAILVCLSAPTSLAIEAATELGLTLVGFVRGQAFNVYSCGERIL
jgi:FdhD protein